ncbi:MAG: histidinol phosphate phosphatase domain-containing protein, partial [Euryarchaeota archaeon]|nr:histidinol phosphate phosphatase domain-containing protein [Euryarchaeota archaeon]
MIDLHTHSIFSDGELIPSELVRRAVVNGYSAIAITDHVDFSNIEFVLNGIKKTAYLEEVWDIQVLAGVEITHVPPQKISK